MLLLHHHNVSRECCPLQVGLGRRKTTAVWTATAQPLTATLMRVLPQLLQACSRMANLPPWHAQLAKFWQLPQLKEAPMSC